MTATSPRRVELDVRVPVWDRFFTVAPLVLVGTRESDGRFDLALGCGLVLVVLELEVETLTTLLRKEQASRLAAERRATEAPAKPQ